MIDIHNHLLPKIDDGSDSIEESIETVLSLKEIGFDKIIITPHYIEGSDYITNNEKKEKLLKQLKEEIKKRKIEVQLFLGNEVYIHQNILDNIKAKEVASLANSRYLLVELPMENEILELDTIIFNCLIDDVVPIIAHPERYRYFQKYPGKMADLIEQGALFQVNYGSIVGQYGKEAMKTAKYMLKNNYVSFLGTDTHHTKDFVYNNFNKIYKTITKISGKTKAKELTEINPYKILANKVIDSPVIGEKKKLHFFK